MIRRKGWTRRRNEGREGRKTEGMGSVVPLLYPIIPPIPLSPPSLPLLHVSLLRLHTCPSPPSPFSFLSLSLSPFPQVIRKRARGGQLQLRRLPSPSCFLSLSFPPPSLLPLSSFFFSSLPFAFSPSLCLHSFPLLLPPSFSLFPPSA